jgi:hypothetical protein
LRIGFCGRQEGELFDQLRRRDADFAGCDLNGLSECSFKRELKSGCCLERASLLAPTLHLCV